VRIGRPRVGAIQAGGQVGSPGIGHGPQPEGAIDVHPRAPLPGPRHDVREGIEGARVHLSGLSAYHRRSRHVRGEVPGPDPPLVIGRDPADPLSPQPHQSQGPDQRGVRVLPDDHGQLWRPEQPVRLHVPAGLRQLLIPGRREGGGIGHGRPGQEHRGAAGRQAEQLGQPPGHHLVQARGDRRHDRQRRVLIPGRRQPVRAQRHRVRAAGDKAEVTAARARYGGRRSRLVQQGQRGGRVPAQLGQWLVEPREPGQRRGVGRYRAFVQPGQVVSGAPGYLGQQRPDLGVGQHGHNEQSGR